MRDRVRRVVEGTPDRSALAGAMISGMFGMVWTMWGASGFTGAASAAIRVAGIVVGLGTFFWAAHLWRSAPRTGSSASSSLPREESRFAFSSPSYLVVVALEVAVIGGGGKFLSATGHGDYIIAWVATVVGMHFLVFGRLFWAGFYWVGTALIAAGIAGAMVGFVGGGPGDVKATSGLIAASSMFVATGWTLVGVRANAHV